MIFADRRSSIFNAIVRYLDPIDDSENHSHARDLIIWQMYCLILAVKKGCECPFDVQGLKIAIQTIRSKPKLSGEAKARLACIEGIVNSFEPVQVPGLRVMLPSNETLLLERVDEILNDAYLLEASFLRRFFGYSANKQAIKRDLSKVLKIITGNRSWARGLVTASRHILNIPIASVQVLDALQSIYEGLPKTASSPVLLSPLRELYSKQDLYIKEIFRFPGGLGYYLF